MAVNAGGDRNWLKADRIATGLGWARGSC